MKTALVIGGVLVGAAVLYIVYKRYNPTASAKNNTILTDIGLGLTVANQSGLTSAIGNLFSSNSDGSNVDAANIDSSF
jgi:hypothetical protein